MAVEKSMRQKVRDSAKALDRWKSNWFTKIDKKHLDMRRLEDCIIGQLFQHFFHGDILVLDAPESPIARRHWGWKHGFNADPDAPHKCDQQFARLKRYWLEEIDTRLNAAA